MCIAAYLALGGGLGVSLSTASHLRIALLWLCWSVLALLTVRLTVRFARTRMSGRIAAAACVALRNARRHILHLPARSSAFESVASSIPLRGTMYGYIKQGHR
jgi:predicted signal transduction protein with EAL and GGDEF domain